MSRKRIKRDIEEKMPVFLAMVGDTFRFLRLDKGVSIRQVAKAIRMTPRIISNIEKGDKRGIHYMIFTRLCNYYGLTACEFIFRLRIYAALFKKRR